MNWDAIGAVAETMAAIGVIITLIYLAAQIRESNRTNTAIALQHMAAKSQDRLIAVASNPSLAAVFGKSFNDLDEIQQSQAMFFMRALSQDLHDQYQQSQLGFVPNSSLLVSARRIVSLNKNWGCLDEILIQMDQTFDSDFSDWFKKARLDVGT
jgi:type I site-specific restriction-modification system R (restriction) subunit